MLEQLRQDLETAEIAALLFVARVTVPTHISAILRKLDVDTRAEAVAVVGAHASALVEN